MIYIIIYIIIITAVAVVLYKLIKTFWKVILLTFLFTLVTLGIISYLVYTDVKDIIDTSKLIILDSNDKIQTGYIINQETQDPISPDKLNEINEKYKTNSLASITEGKYRLFILKSTIFNELPEQIGYKNITYPKKSLIRSLDTNTSEEFLNELGVYQEDIVGIISGALSEEDIIKYKATITGILLFKLAEDPKKLIKQINSENFKMYPSSITITIINQIPSILLESQIKARLSDIKIGE